MTVCIIGDVDDDVNRDNNGNVTMLVAEIVATELMTVMIFKITTVMTMKKARHLR